MSKIIKNIQSAQVESNSKILNEINSDSKLFLGNEENPLGDIGLSRDVAFLMDLGLCTIESHPTSRSQILDVLAANLQIVKTLKRSMAFKLGGILMVANRWGVMTYLTSCDMSLGGGWASIHTVRLTNEIKHILGVKEERSAGYDSLHDYSNVSI